MSDEKIHSITPSNYSITPSLDYVGATIRVKLLKVVQSNIKLHILMEKK